MFGVLRDGMLAAARKGWSKGWSFYRRNRPVVLSLGPFSVGMLCYYDQKCDSATFYKEYTRDHDELILASACIAALQLRTLAHCDALTFPTPPPTLSPIIETLRPLYKSLGYPLLSSNKASCAELEYGQKGAAACEVESEGK